MNRFIWIPVYNVTMKVNRVFLTATVAAISAVAVSSCAYDPYYSGSSYSSGPSYGSGYGSGYGYGGRNFTTTHFVRTSNSRWGYDPYTRCYYDYTRRCYYDPYLNGYYPVGYRPVYVHGAPHPHGWSSRHRYIAPPSRVHDHRLTNYNNRTERYRSLNTDWSRNVKSTSPSQSYDSNRDRYDRHSSQDQSRGTRSSPFFGSNQQKPSSRSYDRSVDTYVTDQQNRRRSEPRMAEPIQQAPRTSRSEDINREERSSRQNRENNSNRERSGRRTEVENPEAMRQPVKSDSHRFRPREDDRSAPAVDRAFGNADERIARRR